MLRPKGEQYLIQTEPKIALVNAKLALAVGLSAATLALVLTNVLGGPALLRSAGLAAVVVSSAIAFAAGAFAL